MGIAAAQKSSAQCHFLTCLTSLLVSGAASCKGWSTHRRSCLATLADTLNEQRPRGRIARKNRYVARCGKSRKDTAAAMKRLTLLLLRNDAADDTPPAAALLH
jgi:hypothetical protein